jgi:hypothetical protein
MRGVSGQQEWENVTLPYHQHETSVVRRVGLTTRSPRDENVEPIYEREERASGATWRQDAHPSPVH